MALEDQPWELQQAVRGLQEAVREWREGKITFPPGSPEAKLFATTETILLAYLTDNLKTSDE